ncbi:hypothetical protein IL306_006480 [Fusarium sp. DS 682]|nr:hypothetical protein IL306_006480 [Fusarium sp. DS 682]
MVQKAPLHSLVVPAMLAEVERSRHDQLVKAQMIKLELWILESRFNPEDLEKPVKVDFDKQNDEKRSAWLNTTYLKNGLITWSIQLGKMIQHIQELEETLLLQADEFRLKDKHLLETNQNPEPGRIMEDSAVDGCSTTEIEWEFMDQKKELSNYEDSSALRKETLQSNKDHAVGRRDDMSELTQKASQEKHQGRENIVKKERDREAFDHDTHREQAPPTSHENTKDFTGSWRGHETDPRKPNTILGGRIRERLLAIKEEYEDWVRECDMRVDGMAIAARWVRTRLIL